MLGSKYIQSSLLVAALSIGVCLGAHAGETQSSSEASVGPSSGATVEAGSQASRASASESSRKSSSKATSQAASQSKYPGRSVLISGAPGLQQTVNEVSRPDQGVSRIRPAHVRKRTAHWKTQVWNQKSKTTAKTK